VKIDTEVERGGARARTHTHTGHGDQICLLFTSRGENRPKRLAVLLVTRYVIQNTNFEEEGASKSFQTIKLYYFLMTLTLWRMLIDFVVNTVKCMKVFQ